MNQILCLRFGELDQIAITSDVATLESIVCGSQISFVLCVAGTRVALKNISSCQLRGFQKGLEDVLGQRQSMCRFQSIISLSPADGEALRLTVFCDNQVLLEKPIALIEVESWIAQLELLDVLMEENENEQNNRGKGCC